MLGAHNIDDDSEFGRQVFGVKEFIIHENWNPSIVKYNDDIALVRLSSPAEFTLSVQPICLMSIDEKFDHGKVVGWGEINDNGEISDVAKTVELKTTQTLPCVLNHHVYARIAWDESFCAHSEKSGVCRGDSGSGFYVKYNGKTYLKGLVSSAVKKACSDNAVALYTDITKYFSSFIKVSEIRNFFMFLVVNFFIF
jgi:secreted trypsin-like serine protease